MKEVNKTSVSNLFNVLQFFPVKLQGQSSQESLPSREADQDQVELAREATITLLFITLTQLCTSYCSCGADFSVCAVVLR